MIKTLYSYEFTKSDYTEPYIKFLSEESVYLPKHKITVNEKTDHGFSTKEKIGSISGIYLIYKEFEESDILVYIGHSGHCIRQRIGRWLSGIRGTERFDENHSAAYKYVEYFGRDTSGLSFKYLPLKLEDLQHGVEIEDIENGMIEKLKPLFNNEIYKEYRFQKILKITDVLGENNERIVSL